MVTYKFPEFLLSSQIYAQTKKSANRFAQNVAKLICLTSFFSLCIHRLITVMNSNEQARALALSRVSKISHKPYEFSILCLIGNLFVISRFTVCPRSLDNFYMVKILWNYTNSISMKQKGKFILKLFFFKWMLYPDPKSSWTMNHCLELSNT